jgi:hypothetical protein
MQKMSSPSTFSPAQTGRPYRSHKVPACETCRKRKIRCDIDIADQPCRFCREKRIVCQNGMRQNNRSPRLLGQMSERFNSTSSTAVMGKSDSSQATLGEPDSLSHITGTSPTDTSIIMNPTMAEDVQVLENYLVSKGPRTSSTIRPYTLVPSGAGAPVVYVTVPKRRRGLGTAADPGRTQREILE